MNGKNTIQSKQWLDKCYGKSSPLRQMVEKWISEFKGSRTRTNDAERSGRLKDLTTPEIIEKIHGIVLDNCNPSQKGYGLCFLRFQQHIVHRLFGKRKNNQQRLLLCIVGKNAFFSRQCTRSRIDKIDCKNQ